MQNLKKKYILEGEIKGIGKIVINFSEEVALTMKNIEALVAKKLKDDGKMDMIPEEGIIMKVQINEYILQ